MTAAHHSAYSRLFRGETRFDFAGRWKTWFAISAAIIVVGMIGLGVRGLNFSIDFKGGTVWEVPTSASVSEVHDAVTKVSSSFSNAEVQVLTNRQTNKRTIKVQAAASETSNSAEVAQVTQALATLAKVSPNDVQLNDVGPSWGSDITTKAIEAVIIFLVLVTIGIWLRFEAKMAIAALAALVHDILITVGIYSLSGFQVSPDTVIAFLTILGYSLYDTIVVFDKVQENTRGLASSNRATYSETVNVSMNQVLARSLNTSLVAIIPILSILVIGSWVLGASALNDFGLALFVGLTTGAYSSIFIASPLLALLKEREPRYAEIRRRLAHATPAKRAPGAPSKRGAKVRRRAAGAEAVSDAPDAGFSEPDTAAGEAARSGYEAADEAPEPGLARASGDIERTDDDANDGVEDAAADAGRKGMTAANGQRNSGPSRGRPAVPPRSGNRPPPRPRKKTRRR